MVWNLLGGYELQRMPCLAGIVRVRDWEGLVERLRVIRDVTSEPA